MAQTPNPSAITEFQELYRRARFLDAYVLLQQFSPPEMWVDTPARIAAQRLLGNLGATRRAQNLSHATWQRDPANIASCFYYAYNFSERHGPLETLQLVESWFAAGTVPTHTADTADPHAVYLWLLQACLLAQFRDFTAAQPWLDAAERVTPDDPWTHVEKASVFLQQDRYAEAIAATERALALRPAYRPAIGVLAHALTLCGRETEAVAALQQSLDSMQSGHLACQLVNLLYERGDFAGAYDALLTAERFWPLAEKPLRQWLAGRKADTLHRLGRPQEAIVQARQLTGRYHESMVTRLTAQLENGAPAKRVELPVGFVRQHHLTCAPATLSAVSAFLGQPIDHLALARLITYDGTPDHEERHWLETHGWHVREFRVTWESAVALLDRGLPFTMVTTWVRSAHMQAVIGYDATLRTLVIRDPYERNQSETLAAEFFELQTPHGPRGMALVPTANADRIADIEFPDAPLYDLWYQLRRALASHDRAAAVRHAEELERHAPGHRLALWAQRALAYYDDNPLRIHETVVALRRLFPKEPNLQLEELSLLQRLGRRAERLERLREQALARGADPAFWREYAEELRNDAREHQRARRYARRLARTRPQDWPNLLTFANVLWDQRDFAAATRVYRLAATQGDKAEWAWQSYFIACRLLRQTDTVLALLRERWQRLGHASALPAQALCRALRQLDRGAEATVVLESALTQRPEDGSLLLFAAEHCSRSGEWSRAAANLKAAQGRVPPAEWLPVAAGLANAQADHPTTLSLWRQLLANDPQNIQALREVARLQAITTGREATLTWLAEQVRRFPHFLPLRQIRLEWLRAAPAADALAEVEDYLALHSGDAWALREKALILLRALRPEEALANALAAEQIEPQAATSAGIVGQALLALRRLPEARAATLRALRLSIDAEHLMPQLIAASPSFEERVAAVKFLRDELSAQPALGQSFLQFRLIATGVLPAEELREALETLRTAQPEHWEIWSATIQQAIAQNRGDDALSRAEEATRRFPLVPRLWVDLADVHRLRDNAEPEAQALARALELSPAWSFASRRLASLHLRARQFETAEQVLRQALTHDSMDAAVLADHAQLLWGLGRQHEAIATVERAIGFAPDYNWAWNLLSQWSRERREPDRVFAFAQQLVAQRPGDAQPHSRLALELLNANKLEAARAAAETALSLDRTSADLHDTLAIILARLGCYDEALDACRAPAVGLPLPALLRGRAAWIDWHRGARKNAVEQLRAVLADHPDYSWGWQTLADWLEALEDNRGAAEAAERLAALNPTQAFPLGYVADLKLKLGEKRVAMEHLRRALRIDPHYAFASFTLLRLECEAENWKEAQAILDSIRAHASCWHALRCEVLLQRARHDQAAALQALAGLCRAPTQETEALTGAAGYFFDAYWTQPLAKTLASALALPDANPEVGALWMRACLAYTEWPRLRRLKSPAIRDEVRRAAYVTYLEWLGNTQRRLRLLWQVFRHRTWLRKDNATWGIVGYALSRAGFSRWLIRWMADWREHREASPWMLFNLSLCLYNAGRDAEAHQVVDAALQLPADHTRTAFVAWTAWRQARLGEIAEARRLLALCDPKPHIELAGIMAQLTESICYAHEAPSEQAAVTFAETRRKLAALRTENAGTYANKAVRRAHYATLQAAAAATRRAYWPIWLRLCKPWHTLSRTVFFTVFSGVLLLTIPLLLAVLPTGSPPMFVVLWPLAMVIMMLLKRSDGSH
ncbi:MAG: tetratricopeptide repeat protein [Opitutae bacterium]|nr:tetratricopeptide repeat protein [Opitutae bacterium]